MDKRKRVIIVLVILLVTSTGSYMRITANSNIRAVDTLIIFATGAIFGLLLQQIILLIKKEDQ